jgi:hypothetical protein
MGSDDGLRLEELRKLAFPIMAMYGDHSQARLTGRELLNVGAMRCSAGCPMAGTSSRPRGPRN